MSTPSARPPVGARTLSPHASALRIDGLDLARGLAVLGMIAAHVGNDGSFAGPEGAWPWLRVAHGIPSALFAVLAGVSMTLMLTRRGTVAVEDVDDARLRHTRIRIATRAAILIPLGYLLSQLGTPVVVILASLGVMFVLALPLLRIGTPWLLGVAAVSLGAGGWAARELSSLMPDIPVVDLLWADHYPAVAWMGYISVGLAIGRLPMARFRTVWLLLASGVVTLIAVNRITWGARLSGHDPEGPWLTIEAHSYSPAEMLINVGLACAVIAICLMVVYPGHGRAGRVLRAVFWPLTSVGTMALTAYVAHLIVIWAVGEEMVWAPSNTALVSLWLGLIVGCSVWRWLVGAGPLERLLTRLSTAAANRWAP